jgi:ribonuclease HI
VIRLPDREIVLQGNDPQSTNNRMELEAAIAALAYLQGRYGGCSIDLHTDSTYLQRGIGEWIERWVANGWQTKARQPVKNQDLWRTLYDLIQVHHVRWHWVKGHAGDPQNERVDRLAGQARGHLSKVVLPSPEKDATSSLSLPALSATDGITVADLPSGAPVDVSLAISCQSETGSGHWVALLHSEDTCVAVDGHEEDTTANLLLLQAAVATLRALPVPSEVTIYTTSDYLGRGASEWLPGWQRRGWRTAGGKPVANREHWQALLKAAQSHHVTWQVVRGKELHADLVEAKRLVGE